MAILLCLITILLTTPWGTTLTLALINNIDGIAIDYHSGSLVRDIELNSFHLQLGNIDIAVNGLSAELDFSCSWQKTLCIKSATADSFSFHYIANEETINHAVSEIKASNQLFEMPFAIKANSVELKKIHLVINKTEISVEQFVAQLAISKNKFNILHPTAKQLTFILEKEEQQQQAQTSQSTQYSLENPLAQLPEVALPIALIIEQLHINDIVVATKYNQETNGQKLSQQWHSSNNRFSGSWVNNDVSIRQFQTSTPDFSISKLVAEAKLKPPYQINAQVVNDLKNVPWWPEISNSTQQISLQGSLEELTIDMISEGSLALTSQGSVNLLHADMPFNITMAGEQISMPFSFRHHGEPSSLSLSVSGNIKQQALTLTSQLTSYGYNNAQVKLAASHQQGIFSINELVFNDSNSASQLNVNGQVSVLPTKMTWQLSTQSSGFSLPKINLQGLTSLGQNQEQVDLLASNLPDSITGRLQGNIASTGAWSEKEWSISISDADISGMINDSKLKIEGDIGLNQAGQPQQGKLFVAFNDSELTLLFAGNSFWNINGQLSVNNINKWVQGVSGDFTSNFSITGKQDNPVISLNGKFSQLNWQHWYSRSLAVQASYQPMSGHQIELVLNNEQLKWVNEEKVVNIENFAFNVDGKANKHRIQASWLGDFTGHTSLEGQLNGPFTQWQSKVGQSEIIYQNTALRNDKPFSLNVDLTKKQGTIESHCWQSKGGSICLPDQAIIGNSGHVAVKLDLDLFVIDELFLPEGVELISHVTGDINIIWSATQPISAQANFSLSPGYLKVIDDFGEHQLSQWSQGKFTFVINEQLVTSKLQLLDTHDKALMNINSTLGFIDDYPIDVQIMLNQFNLQPFQAILGDVVNLQGNLTANIAVDGTLQSPLINGGITLDKGKLLLRQNANTFDNIFTRVAIENNKAKINGSFFLADKEAKLTGNMAWEDSLGMNIDLNANVLPLVFPPQLVMSVSPNLHFSLKEKALTISGNIDVLDGSYNIEKLPEGSVSLSDDVIIIDQHGKAVIKESSGFDIKTDIRVNIAKAFKISGQGLQSHLFGELQISQQEKQPFQLFGRIQSDDGTFEAYGQKLQIEKGEITFNGPIENPYLNLRAGRHIKAEDIDVGILITGLADALDMQLFSSPTMEMPEMLSYLVRGRSLDAGTSDSTAAASLLVGFGVTNSAGLFEQLEKIPFISNIAVDTDGEGNQTQATVSGYVGNNVYLKYGIGVYEPINELTVRMYLLNRFWLEIISGIEQSTDLYYSFDID